ncbi:serine hydrolase domain-containing protein [Consotaella aegiceratis]|uniref:serine hydrolase domain-containing protein n=1 Tax=Consotaella aegiceratis TaxID=3097961 RepID=UPI002F3E8D40
MSSRLDSSDVEVLCDRAYAPVQAAIDEGRIPGGVLGLVDRDGHRAVRIAGAAQIVPHHRPMRREIWFDLASLTKVIFTTPRILAFAETGRIDLDAPLTRALPDLRQHDMNAWERQVTFRQCLGHQTAFPAVEPIYTYGDDPARLRAFVLQHAWRPGPTVYSDINFILLGLALERLSGQTIRDMNPGRGFAWSAAPAMTAATEGCPWRGRMLCGEVHDENGSALRGSGHAGLFGPVDAVLDFALGLLDGSGASAYAIEAMRAPADAIRTLGWERPHPGWSGGERCSDATIGHTGFTGTGLWIDFDRGLSWTLLTNRVHPTRHADSGIAILRQTVGDLINQA